MNEELIPILRSIDFSLFVLDILFIITLIRF